MNIKISGKGLTKFGELWDKSLFDLILDSATEAMDEAKITPKDIEAVFVGNMLYSRLAGQDHLGAAVASRLNIDGFSTKVESACASGGVAVHLAVNALKSGMYKNVLVIGAEKMTDATSNQVTAALMGAGSESERRAGLTFPALYALMANAHMQKYKTTREQLAAVAVKNHYHASLNKKAHFPFEISIEKVINGPRISSPFTLFDASPISDGAASIVLTSDEKRSGVEIVGSAVATDTLDLSTRESLTELKATKKAAQAALKQAGVKIDDINTVEVHDCFTIAEILAMEDLGFCKKGEGGKFIESGITKLGGRIPVNTSGGLKACGHPVGATGVKQIIELAQQLEGISGDRQVKNAKYALAQNVGGTGATVVVHILRKEEI